jgi:hypothetical protein
LRVFFGGDCTIDITTDRWQRYVAAAGREDV